MKNKKNLELINAISVLIKELKEDADYYYGWQSNIAMAMYDEVNGKITRDEANDGAKRFLDILTMQTIVKGGDKNGRKRNT